MNNYLRSRLGRTLTSIVCTAVAAACLPGCGAPPLTFHVVDADSGTPLEGVRLGAHGYRHSLFAFGSVDEYQSYGPTKAEGVVTTERLDRSLTYSFQFKRDGYFPTNAISGNSGDVAVDPRTPGKPAVGLPEFMVSGSEPVRVPLYRIAGWAGPGLPSSRSRAPATGPRRDGESGP